MAAGFPKLSLFRASWTLIDQAIVSAGTFAVNLILARTLVPSEYGTFALILSVLLILQIVNNTLVYYPLSVAATHEESGARSDILWSSFAAVAALCAPLLLISSLAIFILGRHDLLLPTLLWFLAWQAQETTRRILFSEFRHRTAIAGDSISYLGQAAIVLAISQTGNLDLAGTFLILAGTSLVAAVVQFCQIGLRWSRPQNLIETVQSFWLLGRWSLATSVTTALRLQGMLWLVALLTTRSETAQFQGALNVVSVVNPVLFAMCNIIPQTAGQADGKSSSDALASVMPYAVLGAIPTWLYFSFVIVAPEFVLTVFYGSKSLYVQGELGVQILALAFVINYAAEIVSSFLHGVRAPKTALSITTYGNVSAAVVAVPLIFWMGWLGACFALLLSNITRMLAAYLIMKRFVLATEKAPRSDQLA